MICNLYGFIIGLLFGICLMTILSDEPTVVIKYPTPFNTKNITYVDKTGNCYQYRANNVVCPTDNSLIHKLPVNS